MSLKYMSAFQKFISVFCSLVYKISLHELQQETELLGLVSKMETGFKGGVGITLLNGAARAEAHGREARDCATVQMWNPKNRVESTARGRA